jgi:hypothetical protein
MEHCILSGQTAEDDRGVSQIFQAIKTDRGYNMIRNLKHSTKIMVCQLARIWL